MDNAAFVQLVCYCYESTQSVVIGVDSLCQVNVSALAVRYCQLRRHGQILAQFWWRALCNLPLVLFFVLHSLTHAWLSCRCCVPLSCIFLLPTVCQVVN
jgi:hypothetical protein